MFIDFKRFARRTFSWVCTLLVALLFQQASSQTYCVRQGAGGNGSSWSNAYGSLPATLQRGATYYIADGTYPGYTFDDNESGTTQIFIKKATQAEHGTDTGWQAAYGDGQAIFSKLQFRADYYTFDGITRNEGNWREETAYGFRVRISPGKGNDGIIIQDSNGSNVAGNITIRHTYIGSDSINNVGDRAIETLWDTHHITIQKCLLKNCQVPIISRRAQFLTWEDCWVGPNNIAESGAHIEALSDHESDNVTIRRNVFQNIGNTAFISSGNGWNSNLGSGCFNWEISNNVFVFLPNGGPMWGVGNGIVTTLHDQPSVNWNIHHNTAINIAGWSAGIRQDQPTNVTIANNLWYLLGQDPNGGSTALNLPSGPGNTHWTGADPFVDWQNGNFALKPGHSLNTAGSDGGPVGATFGPVEADTTPPSAPSNLQASALTSSRIGLVWEPSTDNQGVSYYRIFRDNNSVTTANNTSFEDTGLQPSQLYSYEVMAVDLAGNESPRSNIALATTLTPDLTPPTAPGNLTATPVDWRQIGLQWTPATDNQAVVAYEIYRESELIVTVGDEVVAFGDQELEPDTAYRYEVVALDDAGNRSIPAEAQATTPESPNLGEGAVAIYHFDEGQGQAILDSSGYGNDGTAQFATSGKWAEGKYGLSLDFNGTDDVVAVPHSSTLDLSDTLTILTWVYPTVDLVNWQHVVSKTRSSNTLAYYLAASSSANQVAAGFNIAGTWEFVLGGQSPLAEEWSHLGATYDGNTLRIYLNGSEIASTEIGSNLDSSTGPLTIGGNVLNEYFHGRIDEVYVYNRCLSASEIQAVIDNPETVGLTGSGAAWLLYP